MPESLVSARSAVGVPSVLVNFWGAVTPGGPRRGGQRRRSLFQASLHPRTRGCPAQRTGDPRPLRFTVSKTSSCESCCRSSPPPCAPDTDFKMQTGWRRLYSWLRVPESSRLLAVMPLAFSLRGLTQSPGLQGAKGVRLTRQKSQLFGTVGPLCLMAEKIQGLWLETFG